MNFRKISISFLFLLVAVFAILFGLYSPTLKRQRDFYLWASSFHKKEAYKEQNILLKYQAMVDANVLNPEDSFNKTYYQVHQDRVGYHLKISSNYLYLSSRPWEENRLVLEEPGQEIKLDFDLNNLLNDGPKNVNQLINSLPTPSR